MSANSRSIRTARVEPSPADKPYWLLWPVGIIAAVLCIVAFVLWGIYGAGTLFDAMIALCI